MTEFGKNKWKYSTIGLLAVLAVGFSFPQAFAHITSSIPHSLTHISDAITALQSDVTDIMAKTDNLPSDPASQSDTGTTKSVRTDVGLLLDDGSSETVTIIPAESGKTFSGHFTGTAILTDGGHSGIRCFGPGGGNLLIADSSQSLGFNEDFACDSLVVELTDLPDGSPEIASIKLVTQYVETSEVTDQTG